MGDRFRMTRVLPTAGAALLALGVATSIGSAQRSTGTRHARGEPTEPRARAPGAACRTGSVTSPRRSRSHRRRRARPRSSSRTCIGCHSERGKAGGLSLASFDAAKAVDHPVVTEKIIRKLRAGMMPPAGAKRPEPSVLTGMAEALERRIDAAAALSPNPGSRPSQRLNRAEYAAAVRELLGLDIDVDAYLPPDTIAHGFDNISEEQGLSAAVMEGYLRAASAISRLAVGDRTATATSTIYKLPRDGTQMRHVPGTPMGTRGGMSVVHIFPADGEYVFKMLLHSGPTGDLFGGATRGEQIEVSVNGERAALLPINHLMRESDEGGLTLQTPPIHVSAGPQRISAAFIQAADGPVDDLIAPIEHTLADTNIGETYGLTALPHLREFAVTGPQRVTGVSETPSRRRIFTCRPTQASEEAGCATEILRRLGLQAYRGSLPGDDLADLPALLSAGPQQGRLRRRHPAGAAGDARQSAVRLPPRAGAGRRCAPARRTASPTSTSRRGSRSFSGARVPDAELVKAATSGSLRTHGGLQSAVAADARRSTRRKRCRRDSRRSGCGCRTSRRTARIRCCYPQWDDTLADALPPRDRDVLRQPRPRGSQRARSADGGLHVRQRTRRQALRHSRNVMGAHFRRVTLADESRRGILGHGSVLQLTSVADRTSPVLRGKWVMEVLLGTPPPPPPPNVPTVRRDQGRQGRADAVGARAHGRTSQEPGVHVVSPDDRSAGTCARELRLVGQVAHQGQRRGRRSDQA